MVTAILFPHPPPPAPKGGNIVDRLDKALGVKLPTEFNNKLLDFVQNDTIMRTRSATAYTEDFILNEMKKDW
ncbi:MAG: hypothetical protein IKN22_00345 [Bacteroidaceae bacterium]|nr:hypothetical protein [Bacteroidaceae bacterium]